MSRNKIVKSVSVNLLIKMFVFVVIPFSAVIAALFVLLGANGYAGRQTISEKVFEQIEGNIRENVEFTGRIIQNVLSNGDLTRFISADYAEATDYDRYRTVIRGYVTAILAADYRSDIRIYAVNDTIPMGMGVFYRLGDIMKDGTVADFVTSAEPYAWFEQGDFAEDSYNPFLFPVKERFVYVEKIFSPSSEFLGVITFSIPERYFFSGDAAYSANVATNGHTRFVNLTGKAFDTGEISGAAEGLSRKRGVSYFSRTPADFPFQIIVAAPADLSFELLLIISVSAAVLFVIAAIVLYTSVHRVIVNLVQQMVKQETAGKEARLAALQHQINPHFIYNTLEVFSSKMKLLGCYDESDALVAFANIFRYNVNAAGSFATVREEVAQAVNYMNIQNLSYPNVSFSTNIPDDIWNVKIPYFIFQPLIENSVTHGTENKKDALAVEITAEKVGGGVRFSVIDNGIGMPEEEILRLNALFASDEPSGSAANTNGKSIGLTNINARLRLYYGDEAHITVRRKDERTVICFFVKP